MGDWITSTDVQPYLGAMTDPGRLDEATAAAKAYSEGRRSDLGLDLLTAGEAPPDVFLGTALYATLIYNARSSPSGYSGFGDGAMDLPQDQSLAYARAMRLIGWKRPVVA